MIPDPTAVATHIKLDGSEYMLYQGKDELGNPSGPPGFRQGKVDYRVDQVAQGRVTSANLPSDVANAHEVNRFHAGLGVAQQVPGETTEGYRYTINGDGASGRVVHASPPINVVTIGASANVDHFIEYSGSLYVAGGDTLKKIDNTGSVATVHNFDGSVITDLAVFRGDDASERLYIALNNIGMYSYDGSTLTQVSAITNGVVIAGEFTQNGGTSFTEDKAAPIAMTLNSWNTLANDDWLIVGSYEDFHGLNVVIGNANGNTSTLAVHYWTGSAWAAVTNLSDGTSSGGNTFAQSGQITWDEIDGMGTDVVNDLRMVPVRLTVSAALDSSVTTTDIAVILKHKARKLLTFSDTTAAAGSSIYRVSNRYGRPTVSQSFDGGTDPTWGGHIIFGDNGEEATGIHGVRGRVINETDRDVYNLAQDFTSLVEALLPEWHDAPDSENGKGSRSINGLLYMARRRTLMAFNPNITDGVNLVNIGLETIPENDTPIIGRVTALAHDDHFLIAAVYNGADTYIMRLPQTPGATSRWQSYLRLEGVRCNALWVTEFISNEKRLYMANAANAAYVNLPVHGPNPLNDVETTTSFVSTWEIYLPRTITDLPQFETNWLQVTVSGDNISATNKVQVFYRTVEGGAYTSLGDITSSGASRAFPKNTAGTWVDVYCVIRGTSASSARLRSVAVEYRKVFPYFREFTVAIDLGATQQLTTANIFDHPNDVRDTLDTLVAQSGTVEFESLLGQKFEVFVDEGETAILDLDPLRESDMVRTLRLTEFAQYDTEGTWDDLAEFTWTELTGRTWDQLISVRSE